jgi:hypothetical protein
MYNCYTYQDITIFNELYILNMANKYVEQTFKYAIIVPSLKCSFIVFTIFFIVFVSTGVLSLVFALKNKDIEVQYNCNGLQTCRVSFVPQYNINPPVQMYYKINNFYSSYKKYAKSKVYKQYEGTVRYLNRF